MPSKHANEENKSAVHGTLYVVATPIGNLSDITLRAIEVLRLVDAIAAEDTRHTRKLLTRFDIHKPLVSYHAHNAVERSSQLIDRLRAGENIAIVTDAGTPAVSDPGALLVREVIATDLPVIVVPGPTALIAALVASGLPIHPFAFLGFPPSRGAVRRSFFDSYAALSMTLVLYESPQRLQRTLEDMEAHWGNRLVAVARELTKIHEEVFRGTIGEARAHFSGGVRGEITLVVAGSIEESKKQESEENWKAELVHLLHSGMGVRDSTDRITQERRIPRRKVYQEALRVKKHLIEHGTG
ncbi:MAG: 16S rRNA (cytidine(1402)-2'-O)-methyltransferase [Syntrophobacteraceae bacterium]